ncbi:hypothetical protein QAD02_000435 [Eretmocerus hayati]|uniref:Uncharacterized protein n=1 Tax=Eretmocerus hayati TaxID=131215 RepID=A0ACC2NEY3_9HYME|nr:hypothetical protein QAD02_000435 [Eretmocerus hayati]
MELGEIHSATNIATPCVELPQEPSYALAHSASIEITCTGGPAKEYLCPYCYDNGTTNMLKGKIIDHLLRKHTDQDVVRKIKSLPAAKRDKNGELSAKMKERSRLIEIFRKRGADIHIQIMKVGDQPQVERRSSHKTFLNSKRMCKICHGLFSQKSLHKHEPLCRSKHRLTKRAQESSREAHNLVLRNYHRIANEFILPHIVKMQNDQAGNEARFDIDIVRTMNMLAKKHGNDESNQRVAVTTGRLLGKINIGMKALHPEYKGTQSFATPRAKTNWDFESAMIVLDSLYEAYENNASVTSKTCQELISANPCLKNRSAATIRSFLQNQKKKSDAGKPTGFFQAYLKRKAQKKINEENTLSKPVETRVKKVTKYKIPNSVFSHFAEHIENGTVPTIEECCHVMKRSPGLRNFEPEKKKNWVAQVTKSNLEKAQLFEQ